MKYIQIIWPLFPIVTILAMVNYQASELSIVSYKRMNKQEIDALNATFGKDILHNGCYAFDIKNNSKDTIYMPIYDSLLIAFNSVEYFDAFSNSKISIPENFDIAYCKQINSKHTSTLYGCFFTNNSIDSIEFSVLYFSKKCFSIYSVDTLKYKFKEGQ